MATLDTVRALAEEIGPRGSTTDTERKAAAYLTERLRGLTWMSEATKSQALAKLAAMRNKVGYPDRWRDYSALEVRRDDALGNAQRASLFEILHIHRAMDSGL